jgi:glucokinase
MKKTLGVDVGGTKIAAGVVTEQGKILYEMREDTPDNASKIDIEIAAMYKEAVSKYPDIEAIGIGAPGFISEDRKVINFAPNVNWRNYPLSANISKLIDNAIPVLIDNDANVAGWAEFKYGVAKDAQDMVMVTVGTGVGGAIVISNRLIRGRWGAAAEIGHMRLIPHGIPCGCGLRGCWEQYASGTALVRQTRLRAAQEPENAIELLKNAAGNVSNITGPMITIAAEAGDKLSREMLRETGMWLGEGCASLAAVLDPEVIVIGGGVIAAGDMLLDPAREAFKSHLTSRGYRKEASLIRAEFGNDAGIVGAGALAFER